jgi:hypothetical protein
VLADIIYFGNIGLREKNQCDSRNLVKKPRVWVKCPTKEQKNIQGNYTKDIVMDE